MSPHRLDPNIAYKRLKELSAEFRDYWIRLQAVYLDAAAGFALVRNRVEQDQTYWRSISLGTELDSEQFQDTCLFSYKQIFSSAFCASSIHRVTQGEVKSRNSPFGANFTTLGQLILVSFYDYWQDYLRQEYAKAKKLKKDEVKHDLWGDIGYLRNSIVHHRGIAKQDVKKSKLIKWFKPGDEIALTPDHMRALFLALLKYHNDLFKEQFPEHYIQVPSTPDQFVFGKE